MNKLASLGRVSILLVDPDIHLAKVVLQLLTQIGFKSVTHVRSGQEAIQRLLTVPYQILVTEWDLKDSNGLELVSFVRRDERSMNRMLPIIMLTGRGEVQDVHQARDSGITEFVVKPFSAQTLFNRIQQIVDHPRSFVVAGGYVGPERRRRGLPPPGVDDRRVSKPEFAGNAYEATKKAAGNGAIIFNPDYTIRQALGTSRGLAELITPEIVAKAQKTIDALGDESMRWMTEDLAAMNLSLALIHETRSASEIEQLKHLVMSIKSRAGTFGYRMASDVARLLYLFLSSDFIPSRATHHVVIQKHIDVLTVIFAQKIKGREGIGEALFGELERLIAHNK